MKILVTGAAGMLGTDLTKRLVSGGHDVTGVDRAEFDILDELAVRDAVAGIRPEWVIHCAAFTSVDVCEKESETAFRVNADGARNIAKACWGTGARMLYISTDYVYDGSKREPYIETDPVNPLSVYGKSKLKGEEEILKVLPEALIVRTSWLFGANGPNFVKAILGQVGVKDELPVVDDQTGNPTYTPDLADALTRLVEADAKGVFHAANEGQCTWFDYAKKILELAGATGITVKPITTEQLA
ncbi:MAG TPA: dTDP-4-dehydrorhamnose reductase, partial [Nitrospirota bacterium]